MLETGNCRAWDYRNRSERVKSFEHIQGREDDETYPMDTTKKLLVSLAGADSKEQ